MKKIILCEQEEDSNSVSSADSPFIDPGITVENKDGIKSPVTEKAPLSGRYLPCHYFDYIAGSSTGA